MKDLSPDPDTVQRFLDELNPNPDDPAFLRSVSLTGYVAGFMNGWTVRLSQRHGETCTDTPCELCDDLTEALSLFSAYAISDPPPPEHLMNLPHLGDQPD